MSSIDNLATFARQVVMKVPLLRPSWHTGTTTVSTAYIQRVSQLRFGGERFLKIILAFPQFFAPLTFDSEVISVKIHIWMWGSLCDIDFFFFSRLRSDCSPACPISWTVSFWVKVRKASVPDIFGCSNSTRFPPSPCYSDQFNDQKTAIHFFLHQCISALLQSESFSICRDLPCLPFLRDWLSQYREERNRKNSLGDKLESFSLRNLENVIWFPVSFSLDDFLLLCCQLRQSW